MRRTHFPIFTLFLGLAAVAFGADRPAAAQAL